MTMYQNIGVNERIESYTNRMNMVIFTNTHDKILRFMLRIKDNKLYLKSQRLIEKTYDLDVKENFLH